jgi:hypothetical protein
MGVLGKPVNGMTFLFLNLESLLHSGNAKDGTDRRALFASRPFGSLERKRQRNMLGKVQVKLFPQSPEIAPKVDPVSSNMASWEIRCKWMGDFPANHVRLMFDWRVKRTSGYGWGSFPSIGSCHYIHPAWSTVEPSSRW